MSKTQVVGTMSEWSGVIIYMFRQFNDGSLTLANAKAFVEHRDPFAITDIKSEWAEFYRKHFRLSVDFSDVVVPVDPSGFDRIIFIPKGLKMNRVVKVLKKKFNVSLYVDDLDGDVRENIRSADKSYAIRLRDRVEADEELKNLSANQLKERGDNIITLLERLVYELKYWDETGGDHLDLSNWTLCAGSRYSDGLVPCVHWFTASVKLHVYWCNPDNANDCLRGRVVVSK